MQWQAVIKNFLLSRKRVLAVAAAAALTLGAGAFWASSVRVLPGGQTLAAITPAFLSASSHVLGAADIDRYRAVFALQVDGNWREADKIAADIRDQSLMGHVLAQRFASPYYKPEFAELRNWLAHYADHPQAEDVYRLAIARRKGGDARLATLSINPPLSGYGDNQPHTRSNRWMAGIAAWQVKNYALAAAHFRANADNDDLSPWQTSASAFWAYRALSKQGQTAEAARYLAQAAAYPRTFYGVLARKLRKEGLSAEPVPELSTAEREELYRIPAARRAAALVEVEQDAAAEQELRTLFPQAAKGARVKLLSLAQELKLPAVQITMARSLARDGRAFDTALYPTPRWQPAAGFAVDPALIYAFARQESGFRARAKSPGGAMGVMQILPATARFMQRQAELEELSRETLMEPMANITLGQSYLAHLLKNPLVEGNLMYLAAAYNAGPARVADWKKSLQHGNDPLLFMETIPFAETRGYIAQVLANYWIYQEMRGHLPSSAVQAARGQWPMYTGG